MSIFKTKQCNSIDLTKYVSVKEHDTTIKDLKSENSRNIEDLKHSHKLEIADLKFEMKNFKVRNTRKE